MRRKKWCKISSVLLKIWRKNWGPRKNWPDSTSSLLSCSGHKIGRRKTSHSIPNRRKFPDSSIPTIASIKPISKLYQGLFLVRDKAHDCYFSPGRVNKGNFQRNQTVPSTERCDSLRENNHAPRRGGHVKIPFHEITICANTNKRIGVTV